MQVVAIPEGHTLWDKVEVDGEPAIAISILVLVSSEFISVQHGLGFLIFSYGGVGSDDFMLAVILYLTAIGYFLDRAYIAALHRLMAWHEFSL